ncbi:MAG TPA: VTT domain-containing protein [Chitinophagaceae bacterium]|jgi:membrane protein DedA with SNARE-associated domain|nr:VTT domain-containing protein [Chitinophagaceae bacterium]
MHYSELSQYILHFSYFGIFLWFAIVEQVTPIPEEVSLASLGYLSMHTTLDPVVCGVVSFAGLTVTDNALFLLSEKGSAVSQKLLGSISARLVVEIKSRLNKHPSLTLVTMALLPKLRFLSPLVAAVSGISWKHFLAVNGAATAFYVTFYMGVGILFHQQLQKVLKEFALLQHLVFILVMLLAGVLIIWWVAKTKKKYKH